MIDKIRVTIEIGEMIQCKENEELSVFNSKIKSIGELVGIDLIDKIEEEAFNIVLIKTIQRFKLDLISFRDLKENQKVQILIVEDMVVGSKKQES